MRQEDMDALVSHRIRMFSSINELSDAGLSIATLEKLADADAFRSIGLDRRKALWEITSLRDNPTGLFKGQPSESKTEKNIHLPEMSLSEHVVQDYGTTSLSLKAHPVSFVREKLSLLHVLPTKDLLTTEDGKIVRVAGLVLVRQRPGTAGGVCFITIEDESGTANLIVFKNLFETKYRREILQSKLLMVEGKLQKEGEVIHVIVQQCFDFTKLLGRLARGSENDLPLLTLSRADEQNGFRFGADDKQRLPHHKTQEILFPSGRNFK
jgi:error-prone DNA polymerase